LSHKEKKVLLHLKNGKSVKAFPLSLIHANLTFYFIDQHGCLYLSTTGSEIFRDRRGEVVLNGANYKVAQLLEQAMLHSNWSHELKSTDTVVSEDDLAEPVGLAYSLQLAYDERQRLISELDKLDARIKQLQAEHAVASDPPTWKNTLRTESRIDGAAFTRIAQDLGYKYILWNDRIYRAEGSKNDDTGLTVEFLERAC
jgi:hypothetical protein